MKKGRHRPFEFVDKVVPKAVERKEGSENNYTGGVLRPCRNGDDFGKSFPPRPRGRPSGRVPLEPPAFFNPSNGHPCPSPGGERPCSPKKGETGKSALWVQVSLIKTTKGFVNSLKGPPSALLFLPTPRRLGGLTAALLHVQKSLAVGIRAAPEITAGKIVAVAQTESHLALHGAFEYGAESSKALQLNSQFSGRLAACARSAGGTAAARGQTAGQAVDAAGPGAEYFVMHRSYLTRPDGRRPR